MNNLLLYIGGLLIVVIAALFGVPYAIDWNSYRGVFEEEASRMLGREVRVQGNVGLRLLPTPYVHAEKLRIGGAVGEETGRALFRADGFTMWLSVPPLLKGIVEAREVQIVKPVLEIVVDDQGHTSLATLKVAPGRFSFVPQDIAFRSVSIIDGSLGITGPNGVELVRLDGLNGEVSADAMDGPFRYRGTAMWNGGVRDVRITTAKQDSNGDLRFKSIVSVPAGANSYTLDGTVRNLSGAASLDGKLTARISTAGFVVSNEPLAATTASAPAGGNEKTKSGTSGGFFDVTANVASEPGRIKLEDIAIALEQGGLPQLISGRSALSWIGDMKLDLDLNSKWLDLDHLTAGASAASGAIPLELARTLFDRLVDVLPTSAQTEIAIAVDQVGLGKQSVSGLKIKASRKTGPLELDDVRAGLPGGAVVALDGVVDGAAGARSFKGTLALSGQSLTRFSTWGFGDNPFSRSRNDGPFSIEGKLLLDDSAIELTDASAEIAGTPVIGGVKLGLTEPRRLDVTLEGEKIDLDDLWPGNPGLSGMSGLITGSGGTLADKQQTTGASIGILPSDVSFDIRAGQLIDGERMLQNVHLDVALQKGTLTVPKLKFESKGGLSVELEGAAAGVPENTRGQLRGIVEASTPEAVTTLTDLLDLSPEINAKVTRWAGLTPLRTATSFSFGERMADAVDIAFDGTLRGGRVVAEARIDKARGGWRDAPADFTAQIETPDVYGFLDQLSGTKSKTGEARPGKVFVKAAGKASDGLVAVAELSAETVELEFNGRVSVPENGTPAAKGEIRVAAEDLGRVMTLAGLSMGQGAGTVPVNGTLAAAHDGTKLTLASPSLKIGQSVLSGLLTYAGAGEGAPARVEAELSADAASLPGLLGVLSVAPSAKPVVEADTPSGTRRRRGEEAAAATPPPPSIWPDQAFDFQPLEGITGTVKASLRSLSLEPGLSMKDARLDIAVEPGRLDVKRLEGAVLGGKSVSSFTLEKQPAGASLAGKLSISISSKGSSESDGDDAVVGDVAAFDIAFGGRALSPSAMMSSMTGRGSLSLGDVTLSGVAPRGVADVADEALQSKNIPTGEPLQNAVRTALKATQLKLGKVTIPVSIADGVLKLDRVQVDTAEGRATFDTALDLQTLVIDSEWKIEAKALTRAQPTVAGAAAAGAAPAGVPQPVQVGRSPLPAVSVVYAGRLADLATLAPSIETGALERELTVRRMERDVDELERLRKLDEERARRERERQQALEAERQRRQRELDQQTAPQQAPPQPAAEPIPVPVDGAGSIDPEAAAAEAETADPAPEAVPRAQAQPKKKRPANSWQPFQISPYQ